MPDQNQKSRKLAAILFADIVAYTALMQESEENAMSILSRFEEISAHTVKIHQGEIIKNYGDGSLILFANTVDAVRCACSMQLQFQKKPIVPLRIGIHVGEVVYKGNDVFGDGVNISSRIESIAVPGAVLLSSNAYEKIRNQDEFDTQLLGTYNLKNVEHPIKVYAVSNNGLVVPTKADVKNNSKAHIKKGWFQKPVVHLSASLFLLLVIFGLFFKNQIFYETISEENREKRISILGFINQTNNAELASYGNMLSDWITRGLIETEKANVVNSANLRHLFSESEMEGTYDQKFAQKSGIDLLLRGRYYLVEDRLVITADITDLETGEVIRTFQTEGAREYSMDILEDLTREIMSYWLVKDHAQFSQDPPNYEAYEDYLKGLSLFAVNAEEAKDYFENAFRLDSSFFPPLFRAWALSLNLGQVDQAMEIQNYLAGKKSEFSNFESLHFEGIVAAQEHRYLDAARFNHQKFELDPGDIRANSSAALMYNSANYPRKVLETLASYDRRLSVEDKDVIIWRITIQAFANYRLRNYNVVHQLITENSFDRMPHALADFHMLALIRLDSIHLIPYYYEKYREEGVYAFTGRKVTDDQLLVNICCELMVTGKMDPLQEYARKLEDWVSTNEVVDFPHDGMDIWNNVPLRQEEARGYAHFFLGELQEAIQAWSAEYIPATNWPDLLERASRLGYCYASVGDTINAHDQLQQIAAIEMSHPEWVSQKSYYQSRILCSLGLHKEAIDKLNQSIRDGWSYFRIYSLDRDPFLIPLFDYTSFKDLVRPKG